MQLIDEEIVKFIVEMLENNQTFSNDPTDLVNVGTGAIAHHSVGLDFLRAQQKGANAYDLYVKRLEAGVGFYEPIHKSF